MYLSIFQDNQYVRYLHKPSFLDVIWDKNKIFRNFFLILYVNYLVNSPAALYPVPHTTFYVEDANFSKEIPFAQHSKLRDSIICYNCKFSLFDDVHFMAHVSFPADILSGTEHL